MKAAGASTLAILASGQYVVLGFYRITLAGGSILYFTDADVPLTVTGQAYSTQLVIRRGALKQRVGLTAEALTLDIASQDDHPSGPFTFLGYELAQACLQGVFDGAKILYSKGFFSPPSAAAPELDTSPGLVPWWYGKVTDVRAGRSGASFTVSSFLADLNVAMPRNILQVGCVHTLFDPGCALSKAAFTTAGAITSTGPNSATSFTTNLAAAAAYYDLGVITFTTGANAGQSRTVRAHLNTNGKVTIFKPLPVVPSAGDAFTIVPGCDKQQATCSSKFSNLARFRGYPYIPVPETLYAGGSVSGTSPSTGWQGGGGAGSPVSGALPIKYVP